MGTVDNNVDTKKLQYQEALTVSKKYFDGDELAAQVFLGKYALTNGDGEILEKSPDEMHHRLAKEFARVEAKYANPLSEEEIYSYFKDFKYIVPQGSPMSGIGNPYQTVSLSNCFVVEAPFDSYAGICRTDQEQAQIMKRRGGVGFDISTIRPKGLATSNAAKTTDGIGVFMERFSNTCREVAQGGRRGALMLSISVHHPEIETFINIKRDLKKVTGANISIRLSDEFMNAVKSNSDYEVRFPVDETVNPKISHKINAKHVWDQIIDSAHASAEPGLLFWDNVLKNGPADCYKDKGFKTVSTNPCGEITLSAYDSCRLLLVNTLSFVKNPFTDKATFDFDSYSKVVQVSQRLMDDMIDLELECVDKIIQKVESDPEPRDVKDPELNLWHKIRQAAVNGRRTGLGVTAIGDTLAALGLRYGSQESISAIEEIYKYLALNAYRSTVEMAKERGAFPVFEYDLEKDHPFINRIMNLDSKLKEDWKKYGRRNIALTTTAPAGSVSTLTQTTSGIEPAFEVVYKRRKKINPNDKEARVDFVDALGDKWQEYKVYHHQYKKWMEVSGKENIEDSPYFKARANDIDWVAKVKAQAAAQKWICHSISNTTNVPNETTKETISDIYMTGWESGTKGVTVYRDGCRDGVLVTDKPTTPVVDDEKKDSDRKFEEHHAPKRPIDLTCDIFHITVHGEKWNAFVGMYEDKPYEIFAGRSEYVSIPKSKKQGIIHKNGSYNLLIGEADDQIVVKDLAKVFENASESAFTRTISLALRHGVPVQYVVEQIEKGANKDNNLFSLGKGMMRVLKGYIKDGTTTKKKCESCGSEALAYQEGCLTCTACGSSKCG